MSDSWKTPPETTNEGPDSEGRANLSLREVS
jgi:hypothetical protein